MELENYLNTVKCAPKNMYRFLLQDCQGIYLKKNRKAYFRKGIIAVQGMDRTWTLHCANDTCEDDVYTAGFVLLEKSHKFVAAASLEYFLTEYGWIDSVKGVGESCLGGVVYMEEMDDDPLGEHMAVLAIAMNGDKGNINQMISFIPAYDYEEIINLRTLASDFCACMGEKEGKTFREYFGGKGVLDDGTIQ